MQEFLQHERKLSFEKAHRRESHSPKCEDLVSSKIIKEIRSAYANFGLSTESDLINYLQFVMILQHMNYINKQKATDEENSLLVEAWNSLKTRTYSEDSSHSKEGITFQNLNSFLLAINHIFPSSNHF